MENVRIRLCPVAWLERHTALACVEKQSVSSGHTFGNPTSLTGPRGPATRAMSSRPVSMRSPRRGDARRADRAASHDCARSEGAWMQFRKLTAGYVLTSIGKVSADKHRGEPTTSSRSTRFTLSACMHAFTHARTPPTGRAPRGSRRAPFSFCPQLLPEEAGKKKTRDWWQPCGRMEAQARMKG